MYDHPTPPQTPPSTPGGASATPSRVHAFIPQIRPRTLKTPSVPPKPLPTIIRRPTAANAELGPPSASSPTKLPPPPPVHIKPNNSNVPTIPNLKRKTPLAEDKPKLDASPPKKQRRDAPTLPNLDESDKPKVRTMKQVIHSPGGKPMPKQSSEVIISKVAEPRPAPAQASGSFVPQVRIVDGQVVLDESSLVVANVEEDRTVDYSRLQDNTGRNHNAYRRRNTASDKWNKKETEKFYNALRQYGTDFTILGLMFPNRSRRQIRNKFKKEEKERPRKVDEALTNRIPIDVKQYKTLLSRAKVSAEAQRQQRPQIAGESADATTTETTSTHEGPAVQQGDIQQPQQQQEGVVVVPIVEKDVPPATPAEEKVVVAAEEEDEEEDEDEEEEEEEEGEEEGGLQEKEDHEEFPLHY